MSDAIDHPWHYGGVDEAVAAFAAERRRQIEVEGWTPEHDDQYDGAELAHAASCYALWCPDTTPERPAGDVKFIPDLFPWRADWFKPTHYLRDLEKAGALLLAEWSRVKRAGKGLRPGPAPEEAGHYRCPKFREGDRVRKVSGSSWQGTVVGHYSTKLTPIGYAVESEREPGSVQIYPEAALGLCEA
jgi:hypothetical protein